MNSNEIVMNFVKQKGIYMQIADYILDNILAKKLTQGDKIQSVREMAADVQVNPNTVMRTFSYLQEEGIIFNKRGIGYFVSDDAYEKTHKLKKNEFVRKYLPEVFRQMNLLNMNLEDLKRAFDNENPA